MKRIAIVTATRAEYGILTPLIRRVEEDPNLDLDLIVTGTHLSDRHGRTITFIEEDGFPIAHSIPILAPGNTPFDISLTMANALTGFAACFRDDRPDVLVILGDRTEMLAIASAAMNERIPIAHLHGGEVTEGAVDDCVRHALTKMSWLHFASAEPYRRRILQMGESPDRVYNVGSLGTENILTAPLADEAEIREITGTKPGSPYAVVTFHPVTLDMDSARDQTLELCNAMERRTDIFFLITMANADTGGDEVNRIIAACADRSPNMKLVASLGMRRYLGAVKYAAFVLGNSSSGIIEAPVLGTPTVNIGDRQKGRLMAATILAAEPDEADILKAMDKAIRMPRTPTMIYGDGTTSRQITQILKRELARGPELKKGFTDICPETALEAPPAAGLASEKM